MVLFGLRVHDETNSDAPKVRYDVLKALIARKVLWGDFQGLATATPSVANPLPIVDTSSFVQYVREDLEAVNAYYEEHEATIREQRRHVEEALDDGHDTFVLLGGPDNFDDDDARARRGLLKYAAIQYIAARKIAKKFDKNATILGEPATARRDVDKVLESLPFVAALKDHDDLFRELELAHYVPQFDVDEGFRLRPQLSLGTIHERATAPRLPSIHEGLDDEAATSDNSSWFSSHKQQDNLVRRRPPPQNGNDASAEDDKKLQHQGSSASASSASEKNGRPVEEDVTPLAAAAAAEDGTQKRKPLFSPFVVDFTATYAAYGFVYSCRRALAVAKEPLAATGTETSSLSGLDSVLLVSYVTMQFVVAHWGDGMKRWCGNPSKIVAGAVVAAGLATFSTGRAAPRAELMAIPWALNGVAQALVYPYVCVVLATQIPPKSRGRVMGSWNTCTATGGVLGAAISAAALKRRGYQGAFEAPAAATVSFGLVLILVLGRGYKEPEQHPPQQQKSPRGGKNGTSKFEHPSRVAVWQMARVPAVCCAYSLLKPIRYLFLFWHNYFQTAVLGYDVDRAAIIESVETAFALLGGLAFGAATDRMPAYVLFCGCLLLLALSLAVFWPVSQMGMLPDIAVVAVVSALVGAVDNLASGLSAAYLVDHNERHFGAASSIASVCSFISACGTVGTIFHSRILKILVPSANWSTIFGLVALQAFGAAALVAPMAIDDLRDHQKKKSETASDHHHKKKTE